MTSKRIVSYYNLYLLVFLVFIMIPGCNGVSCTNGTLVEVPAKPEDWRVDVLTEIPIRINTGDTISFLASGAWDVGLGLVGPNGKEDWCECTVSQRSGTGFRGRVGALIGRVGANGKPFIIGSRKTITAGENGKLFLGSNDNLGPCDKINRGSCYNDNSGIMKVGLRLNDPHK